MRYSPEALPRLSRPLLRVFPLPHAVGCKSQSTISTPLPILKPIWV
jgi:hypothetical protein